MSDIHGAVPQLHDYLEHAARTRGGEVALVCAGQRLTYAEIDARANGLAHALVERGVERGDRVIVFGDNTVDTVVAFWGVLKASAVVSIVNPLTKADKLEYYLKDCRAVALVTDEHLRGVWEAAAGRSPWLTRDHRRARRRRARDPAARAAAAPRHRHRSRRDHLHLGIDRRSQGRDAHAPQHADGGDVDQHLSADVSRTTSFWACCRWPSTTASTR